MNYVYHSSSLTDINCVKSTSQSAILMYRQSDIDENSSLMVDFDGLNMAKMMSVR